LASTGAPDDWRSVEQRQDDALDEALSRLIKAGLLPQSAGTDTFAQVIIPFPAPRAWPGGSAAEAEWMAGTAGQPGWLTGIGAGAAACDARIVPIVTQCRLLKGLAGLLFWLGY
jgi:hypothetical protein